MDQAELESLVIRLVGDVSGYVKAMDQAVKHTEEAATKIEHSAAHIEKFHHRLGEWAEKAEKGLLKVGLVIGAWEAFEKADEAEANMRHLEAMIELNEKSTRKTVEEYKKFSAEISKVTMLSKGETLAILQKAEAYRLTSEQTQKITKDAIALSNIPGVQAGPEGLLRITAAMAEGKSEQAMEMSRRMLPMLRTVKDESEFATEYAKLLSAGLNIAKGDAEDATGQLTKMKQALGGVAKEIGENLAAVIEPAISTFSEMFKIATFGNKTFREITVATLTLIAAIPILTSAYGYLAAAKTTLIARTAALILTTKVWIGTLAVNSVIAFGTALHTMSYAALAARGGVILLGAALATTLITVLVRARDAMKEYNDQLERSNTLSEKASHIANKRLSKQIEENTGGGVREKIENLEKMKQEAEREARGVESALNEARKAMEDPYGKTGPGGKDVRAAEWLAYHTGMGGARQEREDIVKEREKAHEEARGRVEQIAGQIEKLKKAGVEQADEYIRSLQLETTLIGMSAEAQERYKLTLAGVNEEKMQEVVNAQEANRLLKEEEETRKKVNDILKDLEMESYGFDEEQMLIYKLAMAGASQETIDYARALHQGIDAQKEWDDYLEEAAQLNEKYKDPMLKRLEAQERYSQMLKDDVITIETYNAAMDDLIEKTHEANNANQQAALSGSQESLARIAAYQDMLRTPIRGTDGASARGGLVTNLGSAGPSPTEQRAEVRADRAEQLLTQIRDRLQGLLDGGGLLLTPGA